MKNNQNLVYSKSQLLFLTGSNGSIYKIVLLIKEFV